MSRAVAYLGDTALPGPASYLAGILTDAGIPFRHVPSDASPPEALFAEPFGLYVLSDYPSARLDRASMRALCARVEAGAGLLMLGGWESYHGLGGDYDETPLADLLPVRMLGRDDRRNWSQLLLPRPVAAGHPVLRDLPWERPAGIGGYNEFTPRPEATVLLAADRYRVERAGAEPVLVAAGSIPLLVVDAGRPGPAGSGRRACLATDVAPHWIGGFVDWGEPRLSVRMGDDFIEVGCHYARFFRQLVAWCLDA